MDLREQIRIAIGGALAAQEGSDGAADAVMEVLAKQPTAAWCATDETGTAVEALGVNQSRRFDTALYFASGAQPAPRVPDGVAEALQRLIENGAVFGPASSEDALLVARYRQHLLSSAPSVPIEVVGLYNFMCTAFVPMTPQQEQIAVQLELAKRAMLAAAPEAKCPDQ